MNQFLQEVALRVTSASSYISLAQRDKLQRYHNSQLPHLGLSVPEQRAIFKEGYSFSQLPMTEQSFDRGISTPSYQLAGFREDETAFEKQYSKNIRKYVLQDVVLLLENN